MKTFAFAAIFALVSFPSGTSANIWHKVGHGIGHIGHEIGHGIGHAGHEIGHVGGKIGHEIGHAAEAVAKEVAKIALSSAGEVGKIFKSKELQKIITGVALGMEKGMLTGDPANIVLYGAIGGLDASGILNKVKIHGYPVLSPIEQAGVNIFNSEWWKRDYPEQLLLMATKNDEALKALFYVYNHENQVKALASSRAFQKLPLPQQLKMIQDAAKVFKTKQAGYQQDIQAQLAKLPKH